MADKENKKQDEMADINKVDVEPLTDADLDTVSGGVVSPNNSASTGCTVNSNAANACC